MYTTLPTAQSINCIRCPSCGTVFDSANPDEPTSSCINCRHTIKRPILSCIRQMRRPTYPFIYQDLTNPKVTDFRLRHQLQRLLDDASDELDVLSAIRDWSFNQFPTGDPTHWRLDADAILESARGGGCFHCTFYAIVSVQACTALGYIARRLNIDAAQADPRKMPHMVYDVWSNQLNQWVVMDSKANIHFELDSKPLSALEVRQTFLHGRAGKVDAVFGHGSTKRILPKDASVLQQWAAAWYTERWGKNDDRWAQQMPDMTNPRLYGFLSVYAAADLFSRPPSPNQVKDYPVLIWQDEFNQDEHWWLSGREGKCEAYMVEGVGCRVRHVDDFEWPVNRCDLQATTLDEQLLAVNVWTDTPNFSHFQYRHAPEDDWREMSLQPDPADRQGIPRWIWDRRHGQELHVRSVNLFGVGGGVTQLRLD